MTQLILPFLLSFTLILSVVYYYRYYCQPHPDPPLLNRLPWYRQPSDPFEPYQPIHQQNPPIRILFLSTVQDSVTRVDTFLYELYEAATYRHPFIEPYFWGPGYHGYYGPDSLASNVERVYGCGFFDLIYMHSGAPEIQDEFDSATQSLGCGTLLAVKAGDCNNNQCLWEANLLHANLTILRYAHEAVEMFPVERLLEMKKFKYGDRKDLSFQLIGHVPDTSNEWDFYPTDKWEEKSVDALLIGKVDAGYYPIRLTVSEAIKHGRTQIKELRAPPPFVTPISTARFLSSRPETLDWNASRHNFQRTILRSFAHSLRSAKVCVFDGSIEEKAIRKFSQAMLSGCVIASNLVTEHDSFLKGNIIQFDLYDNIETINAKISAALADEHELQRKASACLAYARQYLTGLKELDLLIDLSNRYRDGQRGYVFPYGFTARCRRYHQTDDGELQFVPSWCRSSDRPGGFGRGDRTFIQPGEYHWTGPDPP